MTHRLRKFKFKVVVPKGKPYIHRAKPNKRKRGDRKSAMLDRRHMLDVHRSTIADSWDQIQQLKDPVYMLVDARSDIGKALAKNESPEAQAKLREIETTAIPTLHVLCERAEALELCREAGYRDVEPTLPPNIPGLMVPVIVIASGGLMVHCAGRPGLHVTSTQAVEDATAAKVMD